MQFQSKETKVTGFCCYRLPVKICIDVCGHWSLGWFRLLHLLTVARFRIMLTIGKFILDLIVVSHSNDPPFIVFSDDSLGYEFPFTLKVVQANGIHCGLCPWTKFCKGCPLLPTPDPLPIGSETNSPAVEGVLNYCIAVDWEPTALHLRYQTSLEKACVNCYNFIFLEYLFVTLLEFKVFDEDASVAQAVHQQTEPVSLEQCLQAFTREEQLSGDEKYYCPKCATHQPATKKLQIWRLPPILVNYFLLSII